MKKKRLKFNIVVYRENCKYLKWLIIRVAEHVWGSFGFILLNVI